MWIGFGRDYRWYSIGVWLAACWKRIRAHRHKRRRAGFRCNSRTYIRALPLGLQELTGVLYLLLRSPDDGVPDADGFNVSVSMEQKDEARLLIVRRLLEGTEGPKPPRLPRARRTAKTDV
jgi:hypothetical protein